MKKIMTILAIVGLVLMPVARVAVAGTSFIPPDHYKCYKVKGEFQKVPVHLKDQFVESNAVVVKPAFICNPVEKTHNASGGPVTNPVLHYTLYLIKEKNTVKEEPNHLVINQFGDQELDIIGPKLLAVPTCKDGPCNFDWGQFCQFNGSGPIE